MDRAEVKEVLHHFQKGYEERNIEKIDDFMNKIFLNDSRLTVICTAAVTRNDNEWCKGYERVK